MIWKGHTHILSNISVKKILDPEGYPPSVLTSLRSVLRDMRKAVGPDARKHTTFFQDWAM